MFHSSISLKQALHACWSGLHALATGNRVQQRDHQSSIAHQAVISKPRSVSFTRSPYLDIAIPKAIRSRALRTIADDEENGNVNRVYLTGSCKDEGTASENKPEYVTLGTDKWSRHPGRE
ncbi:hypothetical protein NA56DRAFT_705567 [Hyaloscypha hepaticicola]|uniref:Uncharacterized protein n=1 Tax=Hyaloscypha hepaticicola TaxID=2082293 RepID=A0A2J6PZD0_9HELO|nr:hypothetical protein NA56DRAFT_705567 [Hyaloscypha hepaticicola]